MASSNALIEIGFWSEKADTATDYRPWPSDCVDMAWAQTSDAITVVRSLERFGMIESYEQGYSWCRFSCSASPRSMGICTFTDGVFCWPEGFVHYVRNHQVRPPVIFIEHVMHLALSILPYPSAGIPQWPIRHELIWDPESKSGERLPLGTREYLRRTSNVFL